MIMMVHTYLYCTRFTWWYTCTCIVPDLHDNDTHVPVLYQIYMMMVHMYLYCKIHVYQHHHVDLVQYMYMCTIIIMLIWYNKIHVYHPHASVLYQLYMMMLIHIYMYCTRYTWWCTCIAPDLHDNDGTHVPVLYQIYMMMVHMYLYCTRSTCM
jgi:hypothetical protein